VSAPLLATKFFIPPPGKYLVERPHLLAVLQECVRPGCRLGLLSAPAGSGKTTLVASWAAVLRAAPDDAAPWLAWLSLDEHDNDPAVFCAGLVAALQTCQPALGAHTLLCLQAGSEPDPQEALAALVNDLAHVARPFVLVLDDYHFIHNPELHRALVFFIERIPPHFHLLLLTRHDPPFALGLLRGRGQLLEIRRSDFPLSLAETGLYLNSGWGLNLPDAALAALHASTEGWVAGLQMAALSLRAPSGAGDPAGLAQRVASFSGSSRYIQDYLLEEAFDRQPPAIQDFLLRTSLLEQLCDPLCAALLGAAPPALAELESRNLFIIPLDDRRYWYRYHHLFADFLRSRLAHLDAGALPLLHRRAAAWYEQNGLLRQAVAHALQVEDYAGAARLVDAIAEELWGRGEHATLLAWIDALPAAEKRRYPQLWIWQVSMLISTGRLAQAAECVAGIESHIRQGALEAGDDAAWGGQVAALRAYVASFHGDWPALFQHARRALDDFNRPEDAGRRCGLLLVLGNACRASGDLPGAARALSAAIEDGRRARRPYLQLTALANLAIVLCLQGDLPHAGEVCQEGLAQMLPGGLERSTIAADLAITWGYVACLRGELDEAERSIRQGLELALERGYLWPCAWGYLALARLLLARQRPADAAALLEEAERRLDGQAVPEYYRAGMVELRVRAWLLQGQSEPAAQYLHARQLAAGDALCYPHQPEYLALARLYLADGRLEPAGALLARLLQDAQAAAPVAWLLPVLILQALLEQAHRRRTRSLQALRAALELAGPLGIVQIFVDEGQPLLRLLSVLARQQGAAADYARRLQAIFRPAPAALPPPAAQQSLEALSRRELEIARLLAAGCTNKEIAQTLGISLRTVKYHTTAIYAKLGVHGRAQAAVRVRLLGLEEST